MIIITIFFSRFISSLHGNLSVPKSTIQSVVEATGQLIKDLFEPVQVAMQKLEASCDNDQLSTKKSKEYTNLKRKVQNLKDPFANIGSSFLRKSFFKDNGLVEPLPIQLGYRNEEGKLKEDTFQYVPILKTIATILAQKPLYDQIYKQKATFDNPPSLLKQFSDGIRFQKSEFFKQNPDALQISLYYDDLEVANPLGSKSAIHKLALFYMTILNIPRHENSHLQNIHLVATAYTTDVKKYGFNKILEKIVSDLQKLETGVQFHLPHVTKYVTGSLVYFLGDNLAANTLLGFQESK